MKYPCLLGATGVALAAGPALAHHPLGGATPATFVQGLLSGVGHPMLGLDHFAFLVAMGLLAALAGRLALLPAAFLAASALGAGATAAGAAPPFVELAVAASTLGAGLVVLSGLRLRPATLAGLFAVAGGAHGLAFGEAIVGSEPTPLAAYLVGLALTQYAIAAGAGWLARRLGGGVGAEALPARLVGAAVAGVGATVLFEAIETLAFGSVA